jgi:hypothetical protein
VICRGEIACPSLFFSIRLERIRFGAFTCSAGIAVFHDCSKLGIGARNQTVCIRTTVFKISGTGKLVNKGLKITLRGKRNLAKNMLERSGFSTRRLP